MGRKAVKPKTIFMIRLTEYLKAKGFVVSRFNGGGTSPDGVKTTYQVPHLTSPTILTVGVRGYAEKQSLPPYEERWYCSSIRYEESGAHARYGHTFNSRLMAHELCEFICKRLLPNKISL